MKKCLACAFIVLMSLSQAYASSIYQDEIVEATYVQRYKLKMQLNIPRVYNNTKSLGYRKYQSQSISGTMYLEYDKSGNFIGMSFSNFVNRTHVLSSGKNVMYDCFLDTSKRQPTLVAIGSNKTQKFNVVSLSFSLMAEPNYNIGAFDEDTSLFIDLAGKGSMKKDQIKTANGFVAGTLGCGCYYYGHVSPTRLIWWYGISPYVSDIAAVYGKWTMTQIK